MAARDLIMRLALRNWERAKELSRSIQTSIQQSATLSKEARREMVNAIRERTKAAGIVGRRARALHERSEALSEGRAGEAEGLGSLGSTTLFRQGRKGLSNAAALLAGGGGAAVVQDVVQDVVGRSGVAAIAAAVLLQVKAFVDAEFEKREKDHQAVQVALIDERFKSLEERLREDFSFAEDEAARAAAEYAASQRALAQGGLTPAAEYLEGE